MPSAHPNHRPNPDHSKPSLSVPRRQLVDLIQKTGYGTIMVYVDQGEPVDTPPPVVNRRVRLTVGSSCAKPSQGDTLKTSFSLLFAEFDTIHCRTPVTITVADSLPTLCELTTTAKLT